MKTYEELRKINVNEHVEKKNGLSYLSWAWAVDTLLQLDPDASWEYPEPKLWGETVMIYCTVKAFGKCRTAQLPVMDYKNQPIAKPNAFQVNTAMQRCLAKAISLHGIGLYIYAGEDLPPDAEPAEGDSGGSEKVLKSVHKPTDGAWEGLSPDLQIVVLDLSNRVRTLASKGDLEGACDEVDETLAEYEKRNDMRVALWDKLADVSTVRNQMKKIWESRKQKEAA